MSGSFPVGALYDCAKVNLRIHLPDDHINRRSGRHRWTIERTGAWLGGRRRLRIRYERDSERFYALVLLACSVICFNALQRPP
jgi:transposase